MLSSIYKNLQFVKPLNYVSKIMVIPTSICQTLD